MLRPMPLRGFTVPALRAALTLMALLAASPASAQDLTAYRSGEVPVSNAIKVRATSTSQPTKSAAVALTLSQVQPRLWAVSRSSMAPGAITLRLYGLYFTANAVVRFDGDAMAAFYAATQALGVANQVTASTDSEFGPSLQPSGSDHDWGSNLLVLGGAVKSGNRYGSFPSPVLGGPDDASNRGLLIPSTSLDQYGATLARWFGVDANNMAQVFPKRGGFASTELRFMA